MDLRKTTKKAFSLIELMVVVSIVGILATMTTQKFTLFKVKAYQLEAKTVLKHILTLQETYHADHGTYIAFPDYGRDGPSGAPQCTGSPEQKQLGFILANCEESRYLYHGGGIGLASAISVGLNPRCPTTNDVWRAYETGEIAPMEIGVFGITYKTDVTNSAYLEACGCTNY